MQFLIARPDSFLEYYKGSPYYMGDVVQFYDEILPQVLKDIGIDYKMLHIKQGNYIHQLPNSIYLAWHLHGTLPNIWHLKESCLRNYFYFDRNGYGPWSEIVAECDYKVSIDDIRSNVEQFCTDYIANAGRIAQPKAAYIPDKPYVLVLGQRPDDAVAARAHINTMDLVKHVEDAYKDSDYIVATRPHPLEGNVYGSANTFQTSGNLHTALANAAAIYTVNSGSGFEALLHSKRVFTTGVCDYHWATTPLKTVEEIHKSIGLVDTPIDEENRIQFLHYALNTHFMNIYDTDAIQKKVLRAISEYDDRT